MRQNPNNTSSPLVVTGISDTSLKKPYKTAKADPQRTAKAKNANTYKSTPAGVDNNVQFVKTHKFNKHKIIL